MPNRSTDHWIIAVVRPRIVSFGRDLRSLQRVALSALGVEEIQRWKRVAGEKPPWNERNQIIAAAIPTGVSVLDLGAGARTLASYLGSECKYQPCDIVVSGEDVLYCDFNAGILPAISERYDFAVVSGVIEYLDNVPRFIMCLPTLANRAVVSYAPMREGYGKLWRAKQGWFNHLTQAQFEGILSRHTQQWEKIGEWHDQLIYSLTLNNDVPDGGDD